jgi:hypothetical protein
MKIKASGLGIRGIGRIGMSVVTASRIEAP